MDLKNITPFDKFRRIMEASIPNEFSNTTGFRESLVGRAMFGILRYFKKGIQLGKLEYYKRRLENEYFAAILRFCAYKNIDLKTGVDPSGNEGEGGGGEDYTPQPQPEPDPYQEEYCQMLNIDWTDTSNIFASTSQPLNQYINTLEQIINDPESSEDDKKEANELKEQSTKMVKCCDGKSAINQVFKALSALSGTTDAQIVGYLEQIKTFFTAGAAKLCPTYKGTENEKNLIKSFSTSTDANIKAKADEIIAILVPPAAPAAAPPAAPSNESFVLMLEKIGAGNKSVNISQILGDQLRGSDAPSKNINVYEYLKKIGIENVDEINFVELVKLFRSKPSYQREVSTDNFLNYAGVRYIQYNVADGIIYHVKKTPDNVGINPGEGGKVNYEEDTSLKKTWEKKVEYVKSEFSGFFDFAAVDPFVLLNLSDALRERGKYSTQPTVLSNRGLTDGLANTNVMEDKATMLGLRPRGNEEIKTEKTPYVFTMVYKDKVYYPVFTLRGGDNTGDKKVYRYIGCINFDKIIKDKAYEDAANFKNTRAKEYANAVWETTIKANTDTEFLNFLKIPTSLSFTNCYFDSIYFATSNYTRIKSRIDSSGNVTNVRILFNYLSTGTGSIGNFAGASNGRTIETDIHLKILSNTGVLEDIADKKNIKNETQSKLVGVYFGEVFEFLPGWEVNYFQDGGGNKVVSKYSSSNVPYINLDNPYPGKVVL